MTWDELFGHLLDFQQHQVMVQVVKRNDPAPGHIPMLTTIGQLGGGPLGEMGGSDAIALAITTKAGGACGAVMLREALFEGAERISRNHLRVHHGGVDMTFVRS